jgi:hypothetical protein
MKDGCCSSLHVVRIIQTPPQPAVVKQTLAQTTPFQKDIQVKSHTKYLMQLTMINFKYLHRIFHVKKLLKIMS